MATNKHALIRYKTLDKCFRNTGRKYYIEDLIEECSKVLEEIDPESNGIKLRQIRDDIAFMKSADGWEIELGNFRDGKKLYYRYEDPSFSINNMPLNEVEINHLKSAMDILSQFKGMPQFEWMEELIPKLKQDISLNDPTKVIIDFDNNKYLKGIELLGDLYNAIFYEKVLLVNYQPFESAVPYDIILHPYFLKQYNSRWFLFGYNAQNQKPDWNLALDRIITFREVKGKYHRNDEIEWSEYFEDFIGVTRPEEGAIEKVVLQFFGKTGKYMETKPLHGSQKHRWVDKHTLEVTLSLMINYELERLILSYCDTVKVLKPGHLADKIQDRLKNAMVLKAL
jgi:predicted DNA-binding transcriptional regulator YafY